MVKTRVPVSETARRDPAVVVHPLFDEPEQKVDIDALPPMAMTRSVRFSLVALRGYLLLMMLMLAYRFLELAGVISRHAR
jgi:hypothetical protein